MTTVGIFQKKTQWSREWESQEAHQYVCNYVDPSSDAFVSELRITSSGKDILPDLEADVPSLSSSSQQLR